MAITCDVCGGELMIGAGGKTAKCTVCGVGYSIERLREKVKSGQTENKDKKEQKYLIFSAKHMNWGQVFRREGTWISTEYRVYSDGRVWSKGDYCCENPNSFWGKLSRPTEKQMEPEFFREMEQILDRVFAQAVPTHACDGDGWEMISYERDGSQKHRICGHIYGVAVLEKLTELLTGKKTQGVDASEEEIGKQEKQDTQRKQSDDEPEYVDYEIVDFEIVEDERESTIPLVGENGESLKMDEVTSREEDFVFRTEYNEEIQEDEDMLLKYVGDASVINLPEKTAVLGEYEGNKSVFRYPEKVKKVVFNKIVHTIGDYAFQGCKNLEEIYIPESVNYLWYSCGELEYTEDGLALNDCSHLFEGCTGLKKVVFDKDAWQGEDICDTLFKGCSSLKHVELPETIQWIGRYMFEDCVELEEIVIPDSVNTIGQYAFKGCRKLKNVVLPNHPVAIHPTAFMGTGFTPPRHYTTGFNVSRCCVCGGKLNLWSQCKKCNRQIIYCGDKEDWK